MSDIKQREEKIKQKRMNTPWREFVKEICSWYPVIFYKYDEKLSKFPKTEKKKNIVSFSDFDDMRDNLTKKGCNYDVNKSFFSQYSDFFKQAYYPALVIYAGSENCEYADAVLNSKNVYLSFGVISNCENIAYSLTIKNHCNDILNSNRVVKSDNVYMSNGVVNSFNVFYSKYINNCQNIWFGVSLNGCRECIRCSGLDNKTYYIENIKYSKEEYFIKKKEILKEKNSFLDWFYDLDYKNSNIGSNNVDGINNMHSENIINGYNITYTSKGRNLINVGGEGISRNLYDIYGSTPHCENVYGSCGVGVGATNIYNSNNITGSSNIYYSYFMEACSYCIGCIGLRNESFCILNKQYTKEEWFEKANQIFAKMEEDEDLGKFFPSKMNSFYFNDTVAYLIDDSFTKEEVEKVGYMRREEKIKVDVPQGAEIIEIGNLDQYEGFNSEGNWVINPEILKKVIKDDKGNYYRIVKMEYDFLVKYSLPIPSLHWLDRIKLGFKFK